MDYTGLPHISMGYFISIKAISRYVLGWHVWNTVQHHQSRGGSHGIVLLCFLIIPTQIFLQINYHAIWVLKCYSPKTAVPYKFCGSLHQPFLSLWFLHAGMWIHFLHTNKRCPFHFSPPGPMNRIVKILMKTWEPALCNGNPPLNVSWLENSMRLP